MMRSLSRFHFAAMLVLLAFAARLVRAGDAPPATQPSSSISGTVIAEGDVPLAEMVVFLESPDADRPMPAPPPAIKVSQKDAQFSPRMVVVTVGQSVEFVNDEARPIEHN